MLAQREGRVGRRHLGKVEELFCVLACKLRQGSNTPPGAAGENVLPRPLQGACRTRALLLWLLNRFTCACAVATYMMVLRFLLLFFSQTRLTHRAILDRFVFCSLPSHSARFAIGNNTQNTATHNNGNDNGNHTEPDTHTATTKQKHSWSTIWRRSARRTCPSSASALTAP